MRAFHHRVGCHIALAVLALSFCLLPPAAHATTAKGQLPSAAPDASSYNSDMLSTGGLYYGSTMPHKTALRFVETTGLGKNLSLLLLDEVKKSPKVADAIKKYGFNTVKQTVVYVIKDVQSVHAPAWNSMMATVYDTYFAATEMTSIMQQKERSPYFGKMMDRQPDIADAVAGEGKAIFAQAQLDVMEKLQTAFTE